MSSAKPAAPLTFTEPHEPDNRLLSAVLSTDTAEEAREVMERIGGSFRNDTGPLLMRDYYFRHESEALLFQAMVELVKRNEPVTADGVLQTLREGRQLSQVPDAVEVLRELEALAVPPEQGGHWATVLREREALFDLGRMCNEAAWSSGREGWEAARGLLRDAVQRAYLVAARPAGEGLHAILDDVVATARRFVVMSGVQVHALALWVAHTWTFDAVELSPYLAITSPEKQSGKTSVLKVLDALSCAPWRVVTPSEAVVFRKIERDRPTLLLDEADAIFGAKAEHEGLRAILNAGNEAGVVVPRVGGANRDRLDEFNVYCPKAIAGIGELPSTVADRSITIRLARKARDERVERIRLRQLRRELAPVRERLERVAEDATEGLALARPEIPEELDGRAADAWESLLAIADLAGAGWPERARAAATALSGVDAREDPSFGVLLLADVRRIFEERNVDRVATAELIEALKALEESPWAGWYGRGVGPAAVASLLRRYDVRSKSVRIEDKVVRGYLREDLAEAWRRYVPVPSAAPR